MRGSGGLMLLTEHVSIFRSCGASDCLRPTHLDGSLAQHVVLPVGQRLGGRQHDGVARVHTCTGVRGTARQAGRQGDRQANGQTGRWTGRQINKQTDGQAKEWAGIE